MSTDALLPELTTSVSESVTNTSNSEVPLNGNPFAISPLVVNSISCSVSLNNELKNLLKQIEHTSLNTNANNLNHLLTD